METKNSCCGFCARTETRGIENKKVEFCASPNCGCHKRDAAVVTHIKAKMPQWFIDDQKQIEKLAGEVTEIIFNREAGWSKKLENQIAKFLYDITSTENEAMAKTIRTEFHKLEELQKEFNTNQSIIKTRNRILDSLTLSKEGNDRHF